MRALIAVLTVLVVSVVGCGGSAVPDATLERDAASLPNETYAEALSQATVAGARSPDLESVDEFIASPSRAIELAEEEADFDDPGAIPASPDDDFNTESYDHIDENDFLLAGNNPLSTFSIDVDTASYSNVRRMLTHGQLPPPGAVRIEELVNYFSYDYPPPMEDCPFAVNAEIASCPWMPEHRLLRIGLKGRVIEQDARPPSNLVFLLDVSGSMRDQNKLPLVKQALRMLVERLGENDRIAIVVYASSSGLVLPSTPASEKHMILSALDRLEAGGSTNGGEGIELAYLTAISNFVEGGVNRVILCTDGDFNVGITDRSQLVPLIEEKAASGVFLSVLGFGMGNYKDDNVESLANKGNGNYAYIDTYSEARKVLVEQLTGTLITIAKDVKLQIEFNPQTVAAYRLIGYENRMLAAEDFRDDTKDAGEIGAGHTVTALYEIVPAGVEPPVSGDVPPLRYQQHGEPTESAMSDELLTLSLRYKQPDSESSDGSERSFPIRDSNAHFSEASGDFQFASAVASFGMLLRNSEYKGNTTFAAVKEWAHTGVGEDEFGYRREFLELVDQALRLSPPGVARR